MFEQIFTMTSDCGPRAAHCVTAFLTSKQQQLYNRVLQVVHKYAVNLAAKDADLEEKLRCRVPNPQHVYSDFEDAIRNEVKGMAG